MTFGATAGMAMTAFSSPAAKMQMTAIGGAMGANAGGVLGEVLAEPVYEGGVELVRRGGPLLQKGATILKDKAEAYRNNRKAECLRRRTAKNVGSECTFLIKADCYDRIPVTG